MLLSNASLVMLTDLRTICFYKKITISCVIKLLISLCFFDQNIFRITSAQWMCAPGFTHQGDNRISRNMN